MQPNHGRAVVLYPTFGLLEEDGAHCKIVVRGFVHEPANVTLRKRLMLRVLRRMMRARNEDFQTELFRRRIDGFLVAAEGGRRIDVRVGADVYSLKRPSRRNGHFQDVLRVPITGLPLDPAEDRCGRWLDFEAVDPAGVHVGAFGRAQLMHDAGVSVISDIDDTIKHTQVACRRLLLANTFLREFEPVEGMAPLYRRWSEQGAAFHYVSSSPWQLFGPLAELFQRVGFPAGTFHLRPFRLTHHMLRRLFLGSRRGKALAIRSILRTFPRRRFVLVGDSGERDPEMYGAMARRFPQQVTSVLIRQLPDRPLIDARLRRTLRDVPPEKVRLFHHADELADLEPAAGWMAPSA